MNNNKQVLEGLLKEGSVGSLDLRAFMTNLNKEEDKVNKNKEVIHLKTYLRSLKVFSVEVKAKQEAVLGKNSHKQRDKILL